MIHTTDMQGFALSFVHKRIGAAVKGFVTSGFSPTAAAAGFLGGGRMSRPPPPPPPPRPVSRVVPRATPARRGQFARFRDAGGCVKGTVYDAATDTCRPVATSQVSPARQVAQNLKFSAPPPSRAIQIMPRPQNCGFLQKFDPVTQQCVSFTTPLHPPTPTSVPRGAEVGEAVMGRFGAALSPGSRIIDRAVCLPGMVVAVDGLCYDKKVLRNSDRMYPRGRRPLLTGGEMRAISIASRAAGRMTRAAQRLQDIGLIQKPIVRKRRKK